MTFLDKLDALMHERNINKKNLSEDTGIPYTTIDSFYKKSYDNIKLSNLKKLSDYFGVTLDYLVREDEDIDSQTPQEITLIKKYRSLDAHGKKNIDTLLDSEYERCREEREAYERDPRSDREILDEILNSTTTYIAAFGGDKELRTETMEEVIETLEILDDIVKKEKEQENKD